MVLCEVLRAWVGLGWIGLAWFEGGGWSGPLGGGLGLRQRQRPVRAVGGGAGESRAEHSRARKNSVRGTIGRYGSTVGRYLFHSYIAPKRR